MNWNKLSDINQLDDLVKASVNHPVLIFKHSTRCSMSSTALDRIERSWKTEEVHGLEPYYLDLIQYKNISGAIESKFDVEHQSPQALIIKNGSCVYHASHYDIRYQELLKHL
ncbi:MAG: bacillithiol system redox-active protein YtxJ [Cytophagaceae bacterium]|nr:bacillithiol system redox-active protein YtxJ [Cytophagaceae bacterium]